MNIIGIAIPPNGWGGQGLHYSANGTWKLDVNDAIGVAMRHDSNKSLAFNATLLMRFIRP